MGIPDYPPTLPPQKAALQRCVIRPGVADKQAPAGPGTLAPRPCGSVGPNAGGATFGAEVLALITPYQTTDIARHPVSALIYADGASSIVPLTFCWNLRKKFYHFDF